MDCVTGNFLAVVVLVYTAKAQITIPEIPQCCDLTTFVSCVNETSVQLCTLGTEFPNVLVPTGEVIICPPGTVCDQHEDFGCVAESQASAPGIPIECLLFLTTTTEMEDTTVTTETTVSTTEEPTTTTAQPTTTTEEPTTTTEQPTTTTQEPTTTTEQPTTTTEEPTTTTAQPTTTTAEPTTTTEQPTTTTEEPTTTTEQPTTTTEEPTTTTAQPTTTTAEPTTTTEQPTTTTEEPTTTTAQPTTTTEEPTTTTQQPTTTTEEPTTTTAQPTTTTEEPTTTTEQPTTTTEEPTTTTAQLTTTTEEPTTTKQPPDHFTCTSAGVFPDPNNCSVFYTCPPNPEGGWFQVTLTCPAGYEFSASSKHCEPPEEANCSASPTTPPTNETFSCTSPGRFPNPTNCTSFYICSPNPTGGYFEIPVPCPKGYAFDRTLKRCVPLEEADCSTFVATTTTSTTTTTQPPTTTTRTTQPPTTTTTTTQRPPTTEFQCTEPGKFPHPSNCSLFYVCSPDQSGGYYKITFTCPAGFAYSVSLQRCDNVANVGCPSYFNRNIHDIIKQSINGYIERNLAERWLKLQERRRKIYRRFF